jgi:hypothetical protein
MEDVVIVYLNKYLNVCLKNWGKSWKNLIQDRKPSQWESKLGLFEYDLGVTYLNTYTCIDHITPGNHNLNHWVCIMADLRLFEYIICHRISRFEWHTVGLWGGGGGVLQEVRKFDLCPYCQIISLCCLNLLTFWKYRQNVLGGTKWPSFLLCDIDPTENRKIRGSHTGSKMISYVS